MQNHTINNGTVLTDGNYRVRFTLEQDTCVDSPLANDCAYEKVKVFYYGTGNIEGGHDVSSEENLLPSIFDELPEEHRKVTRPEPLKYADLEIFDEDGDGTTLAQYLDDVNLFDYSWTAEEIEMFFDELKDDFFDELHPKVRATFASYFDFAKTVFGSSTYRDFLDRRVTDCANADVIDYDDFTAGYSPWVSGVLVDFSQQKPGASHLVKTLKQYLDGEVYVAGATVEKVCTCCGDWTEVSSDHIGDLYEPSDELIAFPWADYVVPEISQSLPADFWDNCEAADDGE